MIRKKMKIYMNNILHYVLFLVKLLILTALILLYILAAGFCSGNIF